MQFFKQRRTWNIHTLTVLVICQSLGSQILPAPFHSLFCDTGAGTQYAAFLVSLQASFMFGSANERHWWETGSWWGVDRRGEGGPFPVSVPVYFAAAARGYDSALPRFPAIPKAALQGLTPSRPVESPPASVFSCRTAFCRVSSYLLGHSFFDIPSAHWVTPFHESSKPQRGAPLVHPSTNHRAAPS